MSSIIDEGDGGRRIGFIDREDKIRSGHPQIPPSFN
jgi:hypothetical protein